MNIRNLLALPGAYSLFRHLVGGTYLNKILVDVYIRPFVGAGILDIGCGTAAILEQLRNVNYVGFDMSQDYIDAAKRKYGNRGTFFCRRVTATVLEEFPPFDIAIAIGLLHHLNNHDALTLFGLAHDAIIEGGRFVTLDGAYTERQSSVAHYLISKDRGQYVRTTEQYVDIAKSKFPEVRTYIRHDLLRIPYTHLIMECYA